MEESIVGAGSQNIAIEPTPLTDNPTNEEDEFATSDISDAESIISTQSLSSSVQQHMFANGRRYHRYRHGRYPLPNDEGEQDREDMLHALMLELTNGTLFFANIGSNPQKIIDLGTGTGIWAIEVADRFPSAQVLGIDLSPIQPAWIPPNLSFVVDDIEDHWLSGENFDFAHIREVCIFIKNPGKLINRCFENLKPGGWIELQELGLETISDDDTIPKDWPFMELRKQVEKAFLKGFGFDPYYARRIAEDLKKAGFVNLQHRKVKMPLGTWPKDRTLKLAGLYWRTALEDGFDVIRDVWLPQAGWSKEESEVLLSQSRRALRDPKVHAYDYWHFWTAQKPLEQEVSV